jgi:butyryl-CoA dehydrogenase
MDFDLVEEDRLIQESVRKWAESELGPGAYARDRDATPDPKIYASLAELGLHGLTASVERGGSGSTWATAVIALEEIARRDASVALVLANHLVALDTLGLLGANGEVETLARGTLATLALFEARRFEPTAIEAEARGADHGLSGSKPWITGAASSCVVVAKIGDELGAFLPSSLSSTPRSNLLGLRSAGFADLSLSGASRRVGGDLRPHLPGIVDRARIGVAATALGIGRAALEEARAYALERKQFNQPIGDFQAIQWMLADIATKLDAARLLVLVAASRVDRRGSAAAAKGAATELAIDASNKAIQIFGGNGFVREYPVERYLRDAKTLAGLSPTAEPERVAVSAMLLS